VANSDTQVHRHLRSPFPPCSRSGLTARPAPQIHNART